MTLTSLVVVCVLLIQVRLAPRPLRIGGVGAAVVLTVGALTLGYALGAPGNFHNSQPRPVSERICDDRLCMWPETDPSVAELNRQAADQLGVPHNIPIIDAEPLNPNELRMSQASNVTGVEQQLIIQLLQRAQELQAAESCWTDDSGRRLSMAEEADVLVDTPDLIRLATGPDGRFLSYSDSANPQAWEGLKELISGKLGCSA
ncbi:hypothetical protein GC425_04360 [Corynebacterium sp. zg254]|uniref:Secreted protein n=1 Tax=Corynebacterium zhongnanshanii TaxID=2768834 RepID=A0ABQ6VEG3_9CORY|nr:MULTISPECIES: hypothetical protein [Corynebacterium]KAB3522827.1 hypothetical protein F8377_01260 [Corynebacterium zhongnanshanii]MCR5914104.1 hypothetical protein [Corynebacterium sp. zg254]